MAVTVPEARALVIEFCRTYPVASQLMYYIRNTAEEMYGSRGKGLDMLGGYITGAGFHPGRCDIPSGKAKNADDFIVTLRHEVIGHFGLNTFTGAEKSALLDAISASRHEPSMHDLWAAVDARYTDRPENIKAEEIFASLCEGIEPSQHINRERVHESGDQAFRETCVERKRSMRVYDLESIALMVAQGLHDRTRSQQNFPELNQQLRKVYQMTFENSHIQDQSSFLLAENVKAALAEKPHRFEIHDPFMEVTYRLPTANNAIYEAGRLGFYGFTAFSADGQAVKIDKDGSEWRCADGRALADIQAGIDRDSLVTIEARAELRATAGNSVNAETDRQMALADAFAFRRIQDPCMQENAAVQMADHTRNYPEYKIGLDSAIPGYPGTVSRVYAIDAVNTEKVLAKEVRKAAEMESMLQERRDRAASWTPKEAVVQAQRDIVDYQDQTRDFEREYMRNDMSVNARMNPSYKSALEKLSPGVAQEVEGLTVGMGQPGTVQVSPGVVIDAYGQPVNPGAQSIYRLPTNNCQAQACEPSQYRGFELDR